MLLVDSDNNGRRAPIVIAFFSAVILHLIVLSMISLVLSEESKQEIQVKISEFSLFFEEINTSTKKNHNTIQESVQKTLPIVASETILKSQSEPLIDQMKTNNNDPQVNVKTPSQNDLKPVEKILTTTTPVRNKISSIKPALSKVNFDKKIINKSIDKIKSENKFKSNINKQKNEQEIIQKKQTRLIKNVQPDIEKIVKNSNSNRTNIKPSNTSNSEESTGIQVNKNNQENQPSVIKPIYAPKPRYPLLARRMGYTGEVILTVSVDNQGLPLSVVIKKSSGHQSLDQSASKIILQWRFDIQSGSKINRSYKIDIPVKFTLE